MKKNIEEDKNNSSAYVKKKSILTFVIHLTSLSVSFLTGLLLSRIMGASEYGKYAFALSWVMVLSVIASLGFNSLLVREIASLSTKKNWTLIHFLIHWSNKMTLKVAFILIVCLASLSFLLKIPTDVNMRMAFLLALLIVPFLSLTTLKKAALEGLKRVVPGQFPEKIIRPFCLLFCILAYLFLKDKHFNALEAISFDVFAYIVAFIVASILINKFLHHKKTIENPQEKLTQKIWLSSSLFFLSINAISISMEAVDTILLGYMTSSNQVGIYHVAKRLSLFISFALFVFNIVFAPVIATLFTEKKIEDLQIIVTKGIRKVFIIAFTLTLIFIFLGNSILLLFGDEFTKGYNILLILSAGQIINVACGSVGYLLSMTGYERDTAKCLGIGLFFNIILAIVLIPNMGIKGAAIANTFSTILWNLLMLYFVKKRIAIHPTIFGKII